MAEQTEAWKKKVAKAEVHGEKVYADEVERLENQVATTDKREGREVTHVEKQVARDATFAAHHIRYLLEVIDRDADRIDRALARVEKKQADGADAKAVQRAAEHAAKVEVDAENHVEKVLASVVADIERDAKAAARHIAKGIEALDLDEDDLVDDFSADADRVAQALQKVLDKAAV